MTTEIDPDDPETLPEEIVHWQPNHRPPFQALGGEATGSALLGALALGAMALGAVAVGAMAIGALRIGRLSVGRARFRRLEIDVHWNVAPSGGRGDHHREPGRAAIEQGHR